MSEEGQASKVCEGLQGPGSWSRGGILSCPGFLWMPRGLPGATSCRYTSGRLRTYKKHAFVPGDKWPKLKIEARMKVPQGAACVPTVADGTVAGGTADHGTVAGGSTVGIAGLGESGYAESRLRGLAANLAYSL